MPYHILVNITGAVLIVGYSCNQHTHSYYQLQHACPTLSVETLNVLLPFSSSYMYEVGFSVIIKNKLQMSNSLRLKITKIDVDIDDVIIHILTGNKRTLHIRFIIKIRL